MLVSLGLGDEMGWNLRSLCALLFIVSVFSFGVVAAEESDYSLGTEEEIDELSWEEEIYDPLEGFNRGMFWFNDRFDRYLLEPIAIGYEYVMPDFAEEGVSNLFKNLRYPQYLVSDLVQGKFTQAAEHTGRFLLNSTLGLLGLFDVAEHFGLEEHSEDFGTALGYHGVGPGPYLVLPILGPTTTRDLIGSGVDRFLDPKIAVSYADLTENERTWILGGGSALEIVNKRASLIDVIDTARESAVDYYLFVQSAYYQNRWALIHDRSSSDVDDDISFDDEEWTLDE